MGSLCNHNEITGLNFSMYSSQDIEKISILNVTSCESVTSLGHYVKNGIYDLRLGASPGEEKAICETCKLNSLRCAGHCGHIKLALPVFNTFLIKPLITLMERICFKCYKFQVDDWNAVQFNYEIKMLETGFILEALNVAEIAAQLNENLQEAEEVHSKLSLKRGNQNKISAAQTMELHKALKKYCSKICKGEGSSACLYPTNHTQSIYFHLLTKFINHTAIKGKRVSCSSCSQTLAKLSFQNGCLYVRNSKNLENIDDLNFTTSQSSLTPCQAMEILRNSWDKYGRILSLLYPFLKVISEEHPTDVFFISNLLVVPPRFRPCDTRNGLFTESELSILYKNVIRISSCLGYLETQREVSESQRETIAMLISEIKGETIIEKKYSLWVALQESINCIYDSSYNQSRNNTNRGIRQIIEKKFGLFRQNLMGKRVDFSARSVAAPDPMIGVDEVGVPQEFAMKLTYPVPVNPVNAANLRQLVINGANVYPGVNAVEDEKGFFLSLLNLSENQRRGIANKLMTPLEKGYTKKNPTKIVYRHLQNGDYVLMNRQPTLHKPSIQAHKARVMAKDRVLRMPYANCKAYNADFDGDELNLHFLQNDLARSESKYLMTTYNQYLTPKDGSPLAGLIQDSVVSCVMLSVRGKFFSREDYQHLVFAALNDKKGRIELFPPAIMKPDPLWSGKQIISTIMQNVIPKHKSKPSFNFKTTLKVDIWQTQPSRNWKCGKPESKRESMTESEFVMLNGELLCGVIDKSAIGSAMYGLIHTCYDLYGGCVSSQLLTAINRLGVSYLQMTGHTISVKDFVTDSKTDKMRRTSLKNLIATIPQKVCEKLDASEDLSEYIERIHMSDREKDLDAIGTAYTSSLGGSTSDIISKNEKNLILPNLDNHMRMMVDTGAKGSRVNLNQMASLFGTVALDGKRMPLSIAGKTLPYFRPYDPTPQSGGYIPYRFMTGIELKSYFFLCIVGRDSLQHTAVKTSNSGYVQRCLIKHLEGLKVGYDLTVRNSDGLVLQYEYGEDGLDVTKTPFLKNPAALNVVVDNHAGQDSEQDSVDKEISKHKKKIRKWKKKGKVSTFLQFCENLSKTNGIIDKGLLIKEWANIDSLHKEKLLKDSKCPDPVASIFCKARQLGVVSEALDKLIDEFYTEHYLKRPPNRQMLSKEEVYTLIYKKFRKSLVEPGEAVGAICAQALGEPLTQMTLNTFHFAGRDELNVTLGVPRMIELLRTGTVNISTPIMEVPFQPYITMQNAEAFRLSLVPIPFSKVIHKVKVSSSIKMKSTLLFSEVVLNFVFLHSKELKRVISMSPKLMFATFEEICISVFLKSIAKSLRKVNLFSNSAMKKNVREVPENAEDDDGVNSEKNPKNFDEETDDGDEFEDTIGVSSESRYSKRSEQDYDEAEMEFENSDNEHSDDTLKEEESEDEMESLKQQMRRDKLLSHEWIEDYTYDKEKYHWCQLRLCLPIADGKYDILATLRETLESTNLNCTSRIKKAFVVENDGSLILRTEGIDIQKILENGFHFDLKYLYTNDVHAFARMFGIEAAQRAIIKEIRAVQSAYDIKVDFRHLSLLADYFTCEGFYKACSRQAITTCSSPIQKMSYETCFAFMNQALLQGLPDHMNSPSANILAGAPVKIGSNSFDILTKLSL